MNIYVLSSVTGFLFSILLALLVMRRGDQGHLSRSFVRIVLTAGVWTLFPFAASVSDDPQTALLATKCVYIAAFLTGPCFLDFGLNFAGVAESRLEKRLIRAAYGTGVLLALSLIGEGLIVGVHRFQPYFYLEVGPAYPVLIVFFATTCVYSFVRIWQVFQKSVDSRRVQIKYIFVSYLFAFIAGIMHFGSAYGLKEFFPHDFLVVACMSITAYAIVRHNLMDIEIVFRRATVFAGLFGFVYGTFALLTILGRDYFEKILGWPEWASLLPPILVITIAAKPIEAYLTDLTERYLFQQKYDYRELLRLFTGEVLTLLDLEQVVQNTVSALDNIIKLERCAVYLRENADSGIFCLKAEQGVKKNLPAEIQAEHPLAAYLSNTHQALRVVDRPRSDGPLERASDGLKGMGGALCLPLISRYRLVGFVLLGMKKSGQPFVEGDVEILSTVARTVAIAMTNAQLFSQVSAMQAEAAQKEKMAVIGTLSSGINHEICNPLGIIRGQCEVFLLNYREGLYDGWPEKKVIEQAVTIFNKVIKETDRATGITKRLSTFAKPAKAFHPEAIEAAAEVGEVMDILGHGLRVDNIRFAMEIPQDFPRILCDRKQFQEVVFNILRNAALAIGSNGLITVTAVLGGAGARILISDNGCGIPQEKIGKIFDPFFTTKDPGKGTGLGLFIVKQVVERNQGAISVTSEVGKGTTFTLAFPLADAGSDAATTEDHPAESGAKIS